jgi:PKD repeat protein
MGRESRSLSAGAPVHDSVRAVHVPQAPPGPVANRPSSAARENWFNLSPGLHGAVPGNRTFAALAFDPLLNGTLMFGGFNQTTFGPDGDTWLFTGGGWTNLTANLSILPSARWAALMTWNPWNDQMVMFGGRDATSTLGDTWVFNASGWTLLTPSASPSARQSQFSVFTADPTMGADYLYGGSCYRCGTIDHDSWTFVNGTWLNVSGSVTGGPTILDYGTWNPPGNEVIGYASTATNCSGSASTVSFNGTAWRVLGSNSSPGPVPQGGGLVYDSVDSAMILFGGGFDAGGICSFLPDTWSYSNGTWTNLSANLTAAPQSRCCESVAYDQTQEVVVLVGGAETSQAYIGDTWTFPSAPLVVSLNRSTPFGAVSLPENFSANVSGGAAPLSINWSFGDGSSNATTAAVQHSYPMAGTFTVNFSVRDTQGREVGRSFPYRIVSALVAGASATPTQGEAPLRVDFAANISGGAGPFVYGWDFGDGNLAYGANSAHVYREKGNFSAKLTVRDGSRQTSRAIVNVEVTAPLTVSVLLSPTGAAGDAPLLVNFTALPTGTATPFSARWTFGDGSPSAAGLNVVHLYTAVGRFAANVTVIDGSHQEANGSVVVDVSAPLTVSATANRTAGVAPFSVTFSAFGATGTAPFEFAWSFGDGSPNVSGASPTHVYPTAGRYMAEVTTTDAGGGRLVSTVPVQAVAPLSVAVLGNLTYGAAPLWVSFGSLVSGGLFPESYLWSFGDGGLATSASVTHRYTTVHSYTVNVTITDPLGETAYRTLAVDVYAPLRVELSASPATIALGGATTLTAATTGGFGSSTFAWGLLPPGCGTPTGPTVKCSPSMPGTFNITVSALDSHNDPATSSVVLSVASPPGPAGGLGGFTPSSWSTSPALLIVAAAGGALVGAAVVFLLLGRRGPPPGRLSTERNLVDSPSDPGRVPERGQRISRFVMIEPDGREEPGTAARETGR